MNRCCVALLLGSLLSTTACTGDKSSVGPKAVVEDSSAAAGKGVQPQAVLETLKRLGGSGVNP